MSAVLARTEAAAARSRSASTASSAPTAGGRCGGRAVETTGSGAGTLGTTLLNALKGMPATTGADGATTSTGAATTSGTAHNDASAWLAAANRSTLTTTGTPFRSTRPSCTSTMSPG